MANYNTLFCFAIELPDPEPARRQVQEAIDAQLADPIDNHPIFGDEEATGAPDIEIEGDLLIFSDNGGDSSVELTANLVQWVLQHAGGAPESVGFEWASTCSKPIPDGFGGGCVFITATDQRWMNTSNALAQLAGAPTPAQEELDRLEIEFEAAGGRDPELADRIDKLRLAVHGPDDEEGGELLPGERYLTPADRTALAAVPLPEEG